MLALIGGVFLYLFIGGFFLWGNIAIYVISYLYETDRSVSYDFIFMVDTCMVFANWVGNLLGTTLFQSGKLNVTQVIAIGASTSLIGLFLSSFAHSMWTFLVTYSLLNGFGAGMCYMTPLICAWEWYPLR